MLHERNAVGDGRGEIEVVLGRLSEFALTLGVDNVADELYTPHLSALPAPGRNVKLGVTAQF